MGRGTGIFDDSMLTECIKKVEAELPSEWKSIVENETGKNISSRDQYAEYWHQISMLLYRSGDIANAHESLELTLAMRAKMRRDLGLPSL